MLGLFTLQYWHCVKKWELPRERTETDFGKRGMFGRLSPGQLRAMLIKVACKEFHTISTWIQGTYRKVTWGLGRRTVSILTKVRSSFHYIYFVENTPVQFPRSVLQDVETPASWVTRIQELEKEIEEMKKEITSLGCRLDTYKVSWYLSKTLR